jgi:hypothetical protein
MSEQFYLDTRLPIRRTRWRSNPAQSVGLTRQTSRVQRLIAELDRDIAQLEASLAAEEAASQNLKDVRYFLMARQLRARRDNLTNTKLALLTRLAHA